MNFELAEAVEALGYSVGRFTGGHSAELTEDFAAGRVAMIVSFNMYFDNEASLGEVLKAAGVRFFFYGTDHPYHGFDKYCGFLSHFDKLTISLTGRDELALAQSLFPRPEVFQWLPQGAAEVPLVPLHQRDFDHLVVGNNPLATSKLPPDPETFRAGWPAALGVIRARQLNDMVEVHLADPMKPLSQVIEEVLRRQFGRRDFVEKRLFASMLDLYLRTRIRAETIRALLPTDAKICGIGWDFLAEPSARAELLGSVNNEEVQRLMRRARAVFNPVPPYYSCSERVLEGMSMGTPVVTTPSRFFLEEFGDSLRYYTNADQLRDILAAREPEDVVHDRVARARGLFLAGHTWTARARKIVAALADADR